MQSPVLALAWRNILRYRRRSLVTLTAIAIGVTALMFLWGLYDGIHNTMVRNFQRTFTGSLQVHRQGFSSQPKLTASLDRPETVIAALEAAGVKHWTPRLQSFVLAAGPETSVGTLLVGIQPGREQRVTHIAEQVSQGRFLEARDTYTCVLGIVTARNLEVNIGDPVILLAQSYDGALAAERFTLVGIISSGVKVLDRGMMLAPLATVQDLLSMQGRLSHVVAMIPEESLSHITIQLQNVLGADGLEVLRWDDLFPAMREWVALNTAFYYVFLSVVLVMVVAGLLNTVLVSMLERQREFGVLMALGTRSLEIGAMVFVESLILGSIGILLGTLAGLGLVSLFGHIGIDLSILSTVLAESYIDPLVYTEMNTDHLLTTLLVLLITTCAASLYPAAKASRLQPVEAIRYV